MNKLSISATIALFFGISAAALAFQSCTTSGMDGHFDYTGGCVNITGGQKCTTTVNPATLNMGAACQYGLPPSPSNDSSCSDNNVPWYTWTDDETGSDCEAEDGCTETTTVAGRINYPALITCH
jgi:hypothetical protein